MKLSYLMLLSAILWGVGSLAGQAAIVGPFSATVDFDAAADLDDFSIFGTGASTPSVVVNPGSDGVAGRVQVDSPYLAGQRVLYYTPAAHSGGLIQLTPLGTVTLSIDFRVANATAGEVPRFGLNATANSDVLNQDSLMALPRGNSNKTLTVRNYVGGSNVLQDEGDMDISLANNSWYRMAFTLTKSSVADAFSYDAFLASLDGSGNVVDILRTEDGTFSNSVLYDDGFYSYINFQSTATVVGSNAMDNFQLSVTAVPEGATWRSVLLGILAIAVSCYVKRCRANR